MRRVYPLAIPSLFAQISSLFVFESRIEIACPAHSNSWQRQNSNPPSRSTSRYSISPGVCLARTRSSPNHHVVSSPHKTPSPSPATAPAMTHAMTRGPHKPHPPPQPRHSISIAGHPRSRPAHMYTSHISYLPAYGWRVGAGQDMVTRYGVLPRVVPRDRSQRDRASDGPLRNLNKG